MIRFIKRSIFGILLLVLIGSALVITGIAQQPNQPVRRWPSSDELVKKWKDVPLEDVKRIAEGGDHTAQHYLGYGYAEGLFGKKDVTAALKWYQLAAEGGHVPAWNNLGIIYSRGKLVPTNYTRALEYLHLAADQGLPQAQANIGYHYRDGEGVEKSPVKAREWFELAARQDHAGAMVELGRFYRFGLGVPVNRSEAIKLFRSAAEKGNSLGEFNLGALYEDEGADQEAASHYLHSAEQGNTDAMVKVYENYRYGKGLPKNREKAVQWLAKAAEAGNPWAQCVYGDYHEYPPDPVPLKFPLGPTPPDLPEAVKWYRRSAEQNWAGGEYHLGRCLLSGNGVERNEDEGLEFIRKAADKDHQSALYELAQLYAKGIGEPRNRSETPIKLLERLAEERAADDESPIRHACDGVIFRYRFGLGTERDLVAAGLWYCRATVAGTWEYSLRDIAAGIPIPVEHGIKESDDGPGRTVVYIITESENHEWNSVLTALVKAARDNDSKAIIQLGERYRLAKGAPKSSPKAYLWYQLANQAGSKEAGMITAELEKSLTTEELAETKRQLPAYSQDLKKLAEYLKRGF